MRGIDSPYLGKRPDEESLFMKTRLLVGDIEVGIDFRTGFKNMFKDYRWPDGMGSSCYTDMWE